MLANTYFLDKTHSFCNYSCVSIVRERKGRVVQATDVVVFDAEVAHLIRCVDVKVVFRSYFTWQDETQLGT